MLNFDEIQQMDKKSIQAALKKVDKNPDLDLSIIEHPELWADVDLLANELLWLTDRLQYIEQCEIARRANEIKLARKHNEELS